MATANLIFRDCIEKMKDLPSESVDCIITDPPYGLEFMGKDWDGFNDAAHFQLFNKAWATECLRVLKSGGFLFAMGGTRTHHRLTCGIEDAGFLIRDEFCWVYMQGFPKAQDLGMLIEKKLGGNGKVVGKRIVGAAMSGKPSSEELGTGGTWFGSGTNIVLDKQPTLPLAKEWQGWKTPALKPAFEPIVVAQKPCEGSITENVMKHGVGGYNIDECRIVYESGADLQKAYTGHTNKNWLNAHEGYKRPWNQKKALENPDELVGEPNKKGRYPSNLLMQEECFGRLSKFFLVPKAAKGEKEENIKNSIETREWGAYGNGIGNVPKEGNLRPTTTTNPHPTVKPVKLMEHLIKLTTTYKATILDPFMGSGTTGVAALNLNRNFIGMEIDAGYFEIAQKRIKAVEGQKRLWDE